jgi:hypothetical protein
MEHTTIKRFDRAEQSNWRRAQTKSAMLRLAVFVLVLFTTHSLALWLHPFGTQRFFWNLALGALTFVITLSPLMKWLNRKFPLAAPNQVP